MSIASRVAARHLAGRRPVPVDETGLELMTLLEKTGRGKAWMTKAVQEAKVKAQEPGNEAWAIEDLLESVLEEWFPRLQRGDPMLGRYAVETVRLFAKNPSVEKRWYAKVKRDQEVVKVLRGPIHIDETDLEIYKVVQSKGLDKWMTKILDDAGSSAHENGQADEWDPTDPGMAEMYYLGELEQLFWPNRDLESYAARLMARFIKSHSFEAAWYHAVEVVSSP